MGDASDDENRVTLSLFGQLVHEPCFDTLRTHEQLGYMVFSSIVRTGGLQGFRIIVQSERSALYLETRIEAFLLEMEVKNYFYFIFYLGFYIVYL